ncbi:MAG: DUF4012 domain-containing protein [Patescibacteria group bacterium]|jgi:hypothetical protein
MPDNSYNLETEVNYFSSVLIVDERGEISSHLIDSLLSQGCLVHYQGVETQENLGYLEGKKNFSYLAKFSEIENLSQVDYVFYFSAESQLLSKDNFFWLTKKHGCKILVCLSLDSSQTETFLDLSKDKELNLRLIFYDCVFGPRIKNNLLGSLFTKGLRGSGVVFSVNPLQLIYPIFVESLVGELSRLIFLPDTRGKSYFIRSSEISLQDFADQVNTVYPGTRVSFINNEILDKKIDFLETVQVKENLNEKISETIEWFVRHVQQDPVLVERVEEKAETPKSELFESQIRSKTKEEIKPFVNLSVEDRLDFLFETEKKKVESQETKQKRQETDNGPKIYQEPPITNKVPVAHKGPLVPRKKTTRSRFAFGLFTFIFLLFVFFSAPLVLVGGAGIWGMRQLAQLKDQIEEGNLSSAITTSNSAKTTLDFSQRILSLTNPFYSLIGLQDQIQTVSESFAFAQNLNDAATFSLLAAKDMVALGAGFINGESLDWEESISSIKANLSFSYQQASLAQSALDSTKTGFELLGQTEQYEKLKKSLPEAREILLKSQNFIGVLPKILGFSERKVYLILFQNNMELRPTGGFIGSYGLINLEGGKLTAFEVFDVYQADGQLKGHVEPPTKLKEYLGEATWFLRDSNWDPDFTISAPRAQWFLDKEMQFKVDGTIGVTLEVAKNILAAIGEVEVPEYGEKINKDNLFQKAEYYSELGTFPGSTQKKDFLGSLAKAIFERIKQAETKEMVDVGGAFFNSLESREMMIYFNDSECQTAIVRLGWEGSIRDFSPQSDKTYVFADYLYLNEANVGVNKANFFVTRKVDHQIKIDEKGKAEEEILITYDNQSPSESWPAGRYKTYLRLYLPKGARLTSSLITDPKNPSLWLPFDMKYFNNIEEHGKNVFGYLIEVPIKSKRQIEIKYENLQTVNPSQKINSYLLFIQKQSGAYPSDYTLTFSYPQNLVPVRVIPSAVVGNGNLLVTSKLDKDRVFQIDLAR